MEPALDIARTILSGFNKHYQIFRESSASARPLFEKRQWRELRDANRARIDMYEARVFETVAVLRSEFPEALPESLNEALWPQVKLAYIALLYQHRQPELAETFFNTVATHVLHRRYFNNQYVFSRPAVAAEHIEGERPTYRCYYPSRSSLSKILQQAFTDFELGVPLENPRRCFRNLIQAFQTWIPRSVKPEPNFQIQVLTSPFYRNKAAYLVGRLINGTRKDLFVIALRHDSDGGLAVDAFIVDRENLANLFSVAHSYFMVDMEVPSSLVEFLHESLPEKPKSELYTAIGLQKQGKTLFFRDFNQQLKHSADLFTVAPGIEGMVMYVFTLPSFPFVFKVIRDKFQPPKDTSRALVIEKYQLVKHHDRVGRLADTLEYSDVAFPLNRFEPKLLEVMQQKIPSSLEIIGDLLVVKHLYIEQRLAPLDLYLNGANADNDLPRLIHGIREFGQALRDLAVANIFPGDLLPKNFGVSPYGRVLFYDYDEVCYLTECNFRAIPEAKYPEDEMRVEPWYNVGPNDVFPEEFPRFIFSSERTRSLFGEIHGDLLKPEFWTRTQQSLLAGTEPDLYPYSEENRLKS